MMFEGYYKFMLLIGADNDIIYKRFIIDCTFCSQIDLFKSVLKQARKEFKPLDVVITDFEMTSKVEYEAKTNSKCGKHGNKNIIIKII